jgi:hypothetical protein
MTDASICGLGQAAPNPILLTMKHFGTEVGVPVTDAEPPHMGYGTKV